MNDSLIFIYIYNVGGNNMEKLTNKEASNIYGGIAFAAFIALLTEVAVSITAIIKMSSSSGGSIKNDGTKNEFE
jgi:hypothetical protein